MKKILIMNFIIMLFTAISASAAKWECKASCNIQLITAKSGPDRVMGTGKSESSACKNAKRDATQKAPRGTYARHCQCKCRRKYYVKL